MRNQKSVTPAVPWYARVLELAVTRIGLLWTVSLGGSVETPRYHHIFLDRTYVTRSLLIAEAVQPRAALAHGLPELMLMHCAMLPAPGTSEEAVAALQAWISEARGLILTCQSVFIFDIGRAAIPFPTVQLKQLWQALMLTYGVTHQLRWRQLASPEVQQPPASDLTLGLRGLHCHLVCLTALDPTRSIPFEWLGPQVYALMVEDLELISHRRINLSMMWNALQMLARLGKPHMLLRAGLLDAIRPLNSNEDPAGRPVMHLFLELVCILTHCFVQVLVTPEDHPEYPEIVNALLDGLSFGFLSELFRDCVAQPPAFWDIESAVTLHRFVQLLNQLCRRIPSFWQPVRESLASGVNDLVAAVEFLGRWIHKDDYDLSMPVTLPSARVEPSPWEWDLALADAPDAPDLDQTPLEVAQDQVVVAVMYDAVHHQEQLSGPPTPTAEEQTKRRQRLQAYRQNIVTDGAAEMFPSLPGQLLLGFPELVEQARIRHAQAMLPGLDCTCCVELAAAGSAARKRKNQKKKKKKKNKQTEQQSDAVAASTQDGADGPGAVAAAQALQQLQLLDEAEVDEAKAVPDDEDEPFADMPLLIPADLE